MSQFKLDSDAVLAVETNAAEAKPTEKKTVDTFLNIGMELPYVDEDGNEQTTFVSLNTFGIILDNVEMDKSNPKSENMKKIVNARNGLIKFLQTVQANLEKGEAVTLPTAVRVEMRRTSDKNATPAIDEDAVPNADVFTDFIKNMK